MKRHLSLFSAGCVGLVVLLALPGYAHSLETSQAALATQTIVDRAGRRVTLPTEIRRVVVTCYGGASQEVAVLGGADKIVAQPSMARFPQFLKIYPRFSEVPDAGSFNNVNLEEILVLKPDVVVVPVTSAQANQRIEETGIPVVVVAVGRADVEGLLEEFRMIGAVFGGEKRAAQLVSYWKARLSLIQRRVASVPATGRKRVLYTSSGIPFKTEGKTWWGHHFIMAGGGINVAREVPQGTGVNLEQFLAWDPDVVLVTSNSAVVTTAEDILNNPQLQVAKAVRNRAVYTCPVGAFWWDRPSPEAILGILWLSKVLYPEIMKDIDVASETRQFFRRFYGFELSERECGSMLNPAGDVLRRPVSLWP